MAKNDTRKISKSLQEGLHGLYGQLIEATEALDARVYKRVYYEIVRLTETVVAAFGSDPHPTVIELGENIKLAQDLFVDVATARSHNYVPVRPAQNRSTNSIMSPNYYRAGEFSGPGCTAGRDALEQPIRLDQLKLRRDRLKRLPVTAMSVSMANDIIRDLAETQPGFADKTAREMAIKVGCSAGTITNTPWWKARMAATGRGKAKPRARAPSERPLTHKILAARPDGKAVDLNDPDLGDDELQSLLDASAEDTKEQDARYTARQAAKGR
ncbi:MAG: hypothetical protein V3T84_14600 [Phycisphaerales bacterium]